MRIQPATMMAGDQMIGSQAQVFIMVVAAKGANASARRTEQISIWKYTALQ